MVSPRCAKRCSLAGAALLALMGLASCVNPNAQQQYQQPPYGGGGGGGYYGKNPTYSGAGYNTQPTYQQPQQQYYQQPQQPYYQQQGGYQQQYR